MDKIINYEKIYLNEKNWIIEETKFCSQFQGKFEVILGLGNGYLGLRSATEENYANRHYGLFIGGTFDTPHGVETPELPNGADIINFEFFINNKRFSLEQGEISNYSRTLNLKTGELIREFIWTSLENYKIYFKFQRFTSFNDCHLICQKVTINSLEADLNLDIISGIDGQTTNSGTQHFIDYDSHFYDKKYLQYIFKTINSGIYFYYNRTYNFYHNGNIIESIPNSLLSVYGYDRRKLYQKFNYQLIKKQPIVIESFATVHTSRDFDYLEKNSYQENLLITKENLKVFSQQRYDNLFNDHSQAFEKFYAPMAINLTSKNNFDILSVRFAIYNIGKFTPCYDSRLNIEAKGWIGEEYKGHTFWDTEIYLLPYFIYTNPERARQLLQHRYFVLPSAFLKAQSLNYKGAMWPWETCWINDGETCPTWGEVDWETGNRIKVWPAYNELHISADIMWAILLYYRQTKDIIFLNQYGYEMLLATATFWISKVEKNIKTDKYEILSVTGPNEYKENINNNAFTNYLVYYVLLELNKLIKNNSIILNLEISKKYQIKNLVTQIEEIINNFYLPIKNEKGIIPENDNFLLLKNIENLSYYKSNSGTIWNDYTSQQLNNYQVCKQADVAALFYVVPHLFSSQTIIDNWNYYEQRTLHSSSLSYSMYCATAIQAQQYDLAYKFFHKACEVDLGSNMNSSNNGIHAAAIGGIVKCVLEGFGGVKNSEKLVINPHLPSNWINLEFNIFYQKNMLNINIKQKLLQITVKKLVTEKIEVICGEEKLIFSAKQLVHNVRLNND